jgi:hypothetical protein
LLGQIARAIYRLIERHLAQRGDDEPLDLLAAEQAQAITALPWPDRAPPPKPTSHRSAFLDGYSLYADRLIDANDREGLERVCRYGTRSPIASACQQPSTSAHSARFHIVAENYAPCGSRTAPSRADNVSRGA